MIDALRILRDYLVADADVLALVGDRIYAGRDVPPVGYTPAQGGCVTFRLRGGFPTYSDEFLVARVQCQCYGRDEVDAEAVYRAVFSRWHNAVSREIAHGECEVLGQTLEEPQTQWRFTLVYFMFMLRVGL